MPWWRDPDAREMASLTSGGGFWLSAARVMGALSGGVDVGGFGCETMGRKGKRETDWRVDWAGSEAHYFPWCLGLEPIPTACSTAPLARARLRGGGSGCTPPSAGNRVCERYK